MLTIPDLVMLLARLVRDERVKIGDKAIALLSVTYVLSPLPRGRVLAPGAGPAHRGR